MPALVAAPFPKAQNVSWYNSDTYYEVVFFNDAVQSRITYRLNGTVEKTERYYVAENLPPYVTAKVKRKFPEYRVHGVTETSTEAGLVYRLVLRGDREWLEAEVDEAGHTYVVRRFNRQAAAATVKSK